VPVVLERWVLRFAVEHRFKDEELADYYFGVEPDEALPGRPAYDVGSTDTWSVNVLTNHRISKRWLGILLSEYEWYSSDIEDSPVVDDSGQMRMLIGAAYRLKKK
jgi:outer membrane protein